SSRRRHTRFSRDWSSDVCSSDLFKDHLLQLIDGICFISLQPGAHGAGIVLGKPAGYNWILIVEFLPVEIHYCRNSASSDCVSSRSEERRVGKACSSCAARRP